MSATPGPPPRLLSDGERAIALVEALQPYFDAGYAVYLMGPTWAHLERSVSASNAFVYGSLYLTGRLVRRDRFVQVNVQADGQVTTEVGTRRP